LGCLSALVLFSLLFMPLLFALFWGGSHCEPVPTCQRENEHDFILDTAALLSTSLLFGFLLRWAVNRWHGK
jgi:hypothetical protein